ncbi:hypothetical protein JOE44_002056 [Chryseobacterium sp. PvR013]|uniref:hypothetical protein n=1 Tax=Chryseobacterium sp. PvR013 TaxID=2806595 RepID=UPI001AE3C6E2|nr:hypothetical protein [Chryseobacterium sp. PvR013]MBP1165172.1 hypothetical protein [Chryseobacterium sp. PvR013]
MKKFTALLLFIFFFFSCKGQDKDEKKKIDTKVYVANCKGEYSTKEKLTERDKAWSLNNNDIEKIMNLSVPITEEEWHFSYPITPCNINIKGYLYKGKKYDLQINGGSYISFFDGKKTQILGCELPECKKYFLKSKENMEEEDLPSSSNSESTQTKNYRVNFNKSDKNDIVFIEKNINDYTLKAQTDNKVFFTKNISCDFIEIDTNTKNKQAFNLILGYTDQYQNTSRKIVIPVFFKNNDLFIEKLFIATLGTSAKTGEEEWIQKEISEKTSLKQLGLDKILLE